LIVEIVFGIVYWLIRPPLHNNTTVLDEWLTVVEGNCLDASDGSVSGGGAQSNGVWRCGRQSQVT
jgi:hypothetical protein